VFYETTSEHHESRKKPAGKQPLEKAELFAALRSETPEVFKFCTW
jgi:hypothetical protein